VPQAPDHLHPLAAVGNKNDGCHVEQKNWATVRTSSATTATTPPQNCCYSTRSGTLAGPVEQLLLPPAETDSKVRDGAKIIKKHDTAPPHFIARSITPTMTVERIVALTRTYSLINPAATQRQIQALTAQLLTLTTSKPGPGTKAPINKRARSREATNPSLARILT
jgi:hypothetical protein